MASRDSGFIPEKGALLNRVRRAEGRIGGLQRMVDEETDCPDILTRAAAGPRALQNAGGHPHG